MRGQGLPDGGNVARRDPAAPPTAFQHAGGPETARYRQCARRLGLPFVSVVHLGSAAHSSKDAIRLGKVAWSGRDLYIAPDEEAMPQIVHWLNTYRTARPRIRVATPSAIRTALRDAGAGAFADEAVARLEAVDPDLSARRTVTRAQSLGLAVAAALFAGAVAFDPLLSLTIVELIAAVFFFAAAALRFAAASLVPDQAPGPLHAAPADPDLPVYTVLVPLRDEAHMLRQLIAGLDRIDWPREKLDVKLIVDEDDVVTLGAARALAREPPYEIVVVPAGPGPRTKPMALQYALGFARGDFVTVLDAEDRPHPGQIAEAYRTFRSASPALACLQAPLVIDNPDRSRLASLFAVEYSTLFDGLLPALVKLDLPLPLGGTSNHFRRSVLDAVGGWDPWNVTEDADLGIRLARFGYGTGTITLPTLEEAPVTPGPWIRQRTRWLKGWLQTWLVHMRHPVALWRALGMRRTMGFTALGLGMIVSALAHPVFLATPFLLAADPGRMWSDGDPLIAALAGLSIFNLAAGYAAMWTLAGRTLPLRGRGGLMPVLWLLPLYWLLMTAACVLAIVQLVRRPHYWAKTPHVGRELRTRAMAASGRLSSERPAAPVARTGVSNRRA